MKEANRFPDSVRTIARVDLKDTDDVLLTGEFFSQTVLPTETIFNKS